MGINRRTDRQDRQASADRQRQTDRQTDAHAHTEQTRPNVNTRLAKPDRNQSILCVLIITQVTQVLDSIQEKPA